MKTKRFPRFPFAVAAAVAGALLARPDAGRAQRYVDDPLPVNTVDFRPMDVAQMNLDGPPPPLPTVAPVTAPGGDTGGTRGIPNAPRDAGQQPPGNGIGRTTVPGPAATPVPGSIRLNFQNASLTDVLNALSASAGFIIVQEQPVSGTINLVSQQPVTPEEAVEALNTVLADKGYATIRTGRVLKVVPREGVEKRNLPVVVGPDPQTIPVRENVVTQVIPVRYLEVGKLVDTLRPLLSANSTVSSNDASNALLLTDTQANIHRIAEIVRALDTSVSGISLIRVYTLRYADAKELAEVVTQLFAPTTANNRNGQQPGGFPGFGGFGGFNRGGGGGGRGGQGNNNGNNAPESAAREAAARVVAVADETTNSLVVSAPDEAMASIEDIVRKLDTNTTELTETQIFKLVHADASEVSTALTTLYADTTTANGNGNNNNRGGNNNRFGPQQPQQNNGASERALAQARVVAVADLRTNSVLVNASRATLTQIALTIGRLDASDSRKQHIYVHSLAHADPSNVAYILNGMYNVNSANAVATSAQPSTSRLPTRSNQGITNTDITNGLSSSNGNNNNTRR